MASVTHFKASRVMLCPCLPLLGSKSKSPDNPEEVMRRLSSRRKLTSLQLGDGKVSHSCWMLLSSRTCTSCHDCMGRQQNHPTGTVYMCGHCQSAYLQSNSTDKNLCTSAVGLRSGDFPQGQGSPHLHGKSSLQGVARLCIGFLARSSRSSACCVDAKLRKGRQLHGH